MEPFVFRATRPYPHLGLWAGDRLVVEPGHAVPVVLTRKLPPNYGAILGALEEGALEPVNPSQSVEALAAAVGYPVSSGPAPRKWLRRVLGSGLRRAKLRVLR